MNNHRIDRRTLLAYIDGTLDPAKQAQVEALLENAPELHREITTLRRLQRGLKTTFNNAASYPALSTTTWRSIERRTTWYGAAQQSGFLMTSVGISIVLILVTILAHSLRNFAPSHTTLGPSITTETAISSKSLTETSTPLTTPTAIITNTPTTVQATSIPSTAPQIVSDIAPFETGVIVYNDPDPSKDGQKPDMRSTVKAVTVSIQWVYADPKRVIIAYSIRSTDGIRYAPQHEQLTDTTNKHIPQVSANKIFSDVFGDKLVSSQTAYIREFGLTPRQGSTPELHVHLEMMVGETIVQSTPLPIPDIKVLPDGSVGHAAVPVNAIEPTPAGPSTGPFTFDITIPVHR